MTTADRLREAHDEAQRAFHDMLTADVYGNPDAALTRAYGEAERRVDAILEYAQWERAKAELDALIAADHDHHLSTEPDPSCSECQEASAAMWTRMLA